MKRSIVVFVRCSNRHLLATLLGTLVQRLVNANISSVKQSEWGRKVI